MIGYEVFGADLRRVAVVDVVEEIIRPGELGSTHCLGRFFASTISFSGTPLFL